MAVSKDFCTSRISELREKAKTEPDSLKLQFILGKIEAYQDCYDEVVKKPRTKEQTIQDSKNKVFDPDKIMDDIIKFYMNSEKFTKQYPDIEIRKQKANEIAMNQVKEQQQKRMSSFE